MLSLNLNLNPNLNILRQARRDELHRIGLVVGSGGEDQSLAPQIFVSASGDVVLDGLATGGFVNAKSGVLLGGLRTGLVNVLCSHFAQHLNALCLGFVQSSVVENLPSPILENSDYFHTILIPINGIPAPPVIVMSDDAMDDGKSVTDDLALVSFACV